MWQHEYVAEKLRELREMELAAARRRHRPPTRRGRPLFGPMIGFAGRTLRHLGEKLESWAAPPPEPETRRWRLDRE